ncbi:MAG: hypothetical protein MGU50_09085 [Trichodesmium sp. MAG_R02]|jgi:hypothetical protein|nr:hypothetical protein [Trichodesmium sp. MAG_R02]
MAGRFHSRRSQKNQRALFVGKIQKECLVFNAKILETTLYLRSLKKSNIFAKIWVKDVKIG